MIKSIKKIIDNFDVEENIHYVFILLAALGICLGLYAQHFVLDKNEIDNPDVIVNDTITVYEDSIK